MLFDSSSVLSEDKRQRKSLSPPRQASTSRGSRRQLTSESAGQARATQAGGGKCSIVPRVVTKRGQRPWLFAAGGFRLFASCKKMHEILKNTMFLHGGKRPREIEWERIPPVGTGSVWETSQGCSRPSTKQIRFGRSCTLHLMWKLNRDVNDSFWCEAQSRNVFSFSISFFPLRSPPCPLREKHFPWIKYSEQLSFLFSRERRKQSEQMFSHTCRFTTRQFKQLHVKKGCCFWWRLIAAADLIEFHWNTEKDHFACRKITRKLICRELHFFVVVVIYQKLWLELWLFSSLLSLEQNETKSRKSAQAWATANVKDKHKERIISRGREKEKKKIRLNQRSQAEEFISSPLLPFSASD